MGRMALRRRLPKLPIRKHGMQRKKRQKQDIWIYNDGKIERENICPERLMRLIYENPIGGASLLWLVKRKALSRLYGLYCRTPMSARGIPRFIKKYDIDMTDCDGPYKNFAAFFSRERRNVIFPEDNSILGSPCEGLVGVVKEITSKEVIFAKGSGFSLEELFSDVDLAKLYEGGTMISIRLTPANYHRMHFFDDGVISSTRMIKGDLYSVNPLALNRVMRLYCRNKRALIKFSTLNFGDVVMVEVGATFVGSIVHCFTDGQNVNRGDLASYFRPGGSLVLLFLKQGAFEPNEALVKRTNAGIETKVSIGESLGHSAM